MIKVELTNFKQYKNMNFLLSNHNLIYGYNGSGKTTIIDALDLFFSEQHQLYAQLINESESSNDIISLFQHYVSNRTTLHSSQHFSHFSHNKTSFEIKFIFSFNNITYSIKKKFNHNGNIDIICNFEINETHYLFIKEFFDYQFIYFKKNFIPSHLSKGELAIKFLNSSLYEIANILKNKDPQKLIIAFDEPDSKIHPTALEPILENLLSRNIISLFTTTNIYTLEYYIKKKGNIILTHRSLVDNKYISHTEKFISSDMDDPDITEKIYNSPTFSEILPYKKFLFVEGKSDKQFFDILLHDKLDITQVEVISIDGQDNFLSKEKLNPFLNLLRSMYQKNPLIFAIFDYDKEGMAYAHQFSQIIKTSHIYFINRKSYTDITQNYGQSLLELQNIFSNDSVSTYVLEDYLKKEFKKPKTKKTVKPSSVVKELKDSLSFKLKRLHITDQTLDTFLNEFSEWLPQKINIESELYKNEQSNKYVNIFDNKKINENNLKTSDYNSIKKMMFQIFGNNSRNFDLTMRKSNKNIHEIKQLRNLKSILEIPDYVLKIKNKTIEYLPNYNYYEFNNRTKEGILSKDLVSLLKILMND